MEYLHLQRPIDGIWGDLTITGVPVTLTAVSEAGEYIDLGTTTTNGYYGTFSLAWTPSNEGKYEIIASFAGDDSYGSSAAATAVMVGPATSASTPIEPEQPEEPTTEEPTTPDEPTPEEPASPEEPEPETTTETPLISTEVAIAVAVVVACAIGVASFWVMKKRK
jgi:hypothetical protein